MGDAIASGLFALGGAVVGGATSFVATTIDARNRRRDAEAARQDALAQTRRTLYSTLVERADLTVDAARRMWAHAEAADIKTDDYDAYVRTWESLVQARASVEIAGPEDTATAATALSRSVSDLCNCVDAWINGAEWTPVTDKQYAAAAEVRLRCRTSFISVAQQVLSTGS